MYRVRRSNELNHRLFSSMAEAATAVHVPSLMRVRSMGQSRRLATAPATTLAQRYATAGLLLLVIVEENRSENTGLSDS